MAKPVYKQWKIVFFLVTLYYLEEILPQMLFFAKILVGFLGRTGDLLPTSQFLNTNAQPMHSLESLVTLIKKFQKNDKNVQAFIDDFQELYFNERVFERIPEGIQEPMDNIVLAVGLTVVDEEERDEFGPEIAPDRLKYIIEENLSLVEAGI